MATAWWDDATGVSGAGKWVPLVDLAHQDSWNGDGTSLEFLPAFLWKHSSPKWAGHGILSLAGKKL